jgi:large subunit ribosomal protein L13
MVNSKLKWKLIDAKKLILGRLSSKIAKLVLMGENVVVINAKDVIVSGNKRQIIERYNHYRQIKTRSNPKKGPFRVGLRPDTFVRKTIRGMLPMKKQRGKDAIRRVHVFISSIPEEKEILYGTPEMINIDDPKYKSDTLTHKSVSVGEICKVIGWSQGGG